MSHLKDKLTISDSINLNKEREFNHLRINNLDEFFDSYGNHYDYYESPWKILQLLEQKIKYSNFPKPILYIPYKPGGDVIFNLVKTERNNNGIRVVEYEFASFIS